MLVGVSLFTAEFGNPSLGFAIAFAITAGTPFHLCC